MKSEGLTLVECLVSILLSLLLIQVVLFVYEASTRIDHRILNEIELDREVYRVFEILKSDIQMRGYMGCKKLSSAHDVTGELTLTPDNQLTISEDAITTRHASSSFETIITMINSSSIIISKNETFEVGDRILIADCLGGEVAIIKRINEDGKKAILYFDKPLKRMFAEGAEVFHFEVNQYDVSASGLSVRGVEGESELLSDKVKDIRFHYYVISNGTLTEVESERGEVSNIIGIKIEISMLDKNIIKKFTHYVSMKGLFR